MLEEVQVPVASWSPCRAPDARLRGQTPENGCPAGSRLEIVSTLAGFIEIDRRHDHGSAIPSAVSNSLLVIMSGPAPHQKSLILPTQISTEAQEKCPVLHIRCTWSVETL